jgi:hypothetical protein
MKSWLMKATHEPAVLATVMVSGINLLVAAALLQITNRSVSVFYAVLASALSLFLASLLGLLASGLALLARRLLARDRMEAVDSGANQTRRECT